MQQQEIFLKLKSLFHLPQPKILIIDDHKMIQKSQKMVVVNNFPASLVSLPDSYSEAKNLLKDNQYDIIFLDNDLNQWPDSNKISGTKTIPLIRETNPDSFILFTSSEEEIGEILMGQGRIDYYRKKSDFGNLIKEIKSL